MDLGLPAGLALAKPISLASRGVWVLLLMGPKVFGSSLIAGVGSGLFWQNHPHRMVCFVSHGNEAVTQIYVFSEMILQSAGLVLR